MNVLETMFASGFAACAHKDQVRKYTGEPYHKHLDEVGGLLAEHNMPTCVIQAGYLHDILEDTQLTEADLRAWFPKETVDLVLEVTDVSTPGDGNRRVRKALDLAHLAKSSIYGATIKLADMVSNTHSVVKNDPSFAKVYIPEKEQLLKVLTHGEPALYTLASVAVENAKAALSEITEDDWKTINVVEYAKRFK